MLANKKEKKIHKKTNNHKYYSLHIYLNRVKHLFLKQNQKNDFK